MFARFCSGVAVRWISAAMVLSITVRGMLTLGISNTRLYSVSPELRIRLTVRATRAPLPGEDVIHTTLVPSTETSAIGSVRVVVHQASGSLAPGDPLLLRGALFQFVFQCFRQRRESKFESSADQPSWQNLLGCKHG